MKLKNLIYAVAIGASLTVASCSKNKFDVNNNPDGVTEASVSPSSLLPTAQYNISAHIANDYWHLSWWMGHGARSGSFQTFTEEETYNFTNSFKANFWNTLYYNANHNTIIINKSIASGAGTYEAIARIQRVLAMQMLVDQYGNIPFSEAFKGTANTTPKYDKGVDIYNALFNELDLAIAKLNNATATDPAKNPSIETADLIYKGNTTNWKRFANTLRLRMLIHLHNGGAGTVIGSPAASVVPGVNIAAQVGKITSDGFITADVTLNPGFLAAKPQPYFGAFNTSATGVSNQRDWARASDYAIRYYGYNGDIRRDRFYVAPSGGHKGIVFGTPSGAPGAIQGSGLSTVRGPGLSLNGPASNAWIFTLAESFFLQAEARQRGVITTGPSAAALLTSGVRASFTTLGLTAAQADAYLSANAGYPDVDIAAPGGGILTILSQKWFALNTFNPLEIYTDWRRTDLQYGSHPAIGFDAGPTLSVDPGRTATTIPKRLFYPQSEFSLNAANVNNEPPVNVFTSRIFWDLN